MYMDTIRSETRLSVTEWTKHTEVKQDKTRARTMAFKLHSSEQLCLLTKECSYTLLKWVG